ncbi:MAG TPA: hypothetical protein VFU47_08875 [Armatimonadota bacterium]|nr:hypothetical protein [Armatimonadota bacterium]
MPFITRNGQEKYADVYVRQAGDTLTRTIDFTYDPKMPAETEEFSVAGLTDYQRSGRVMELIREVAGPHYTALWLGRGWKAELSSGTSVWQTTS